MRDVQTGNLKVVEHFNGEWRDQGFVLSSKTRHRTGSDASTQEGNLYSDSGLCHASITLFRKQCNIHMITVKSVMMIGITMKKMI